MRKTLLLGALILSGCMAGEITTSRVDNKTIAVGVTKIDDNTYDVNARLDDPFQSIDRISDFVRFNKASDERMATICPKFTKIEARSPAHEYLARYTCSLNK
jgi:hypothetical protein